MGNGMNKIIHGVYVGNIRDATNESVLEENNITHIISIHNSPSKDLKKMKYLLVTAMDNHTENLSQHFHKCNDFIHEARVKGGGVLIHCLAGVSRSVTITVAYIMTITHMGWRDALGVVRTGRACANPNHGFQRQLLTFEHEKLKHERKRLFKKFPHSHFDDHEECKTLLMQHLNWVLNGDEKSANTNKIPNADLQYLPLEAFREHEKSGVSATSYLASAAASISKRIPSELAHEENLVNHTEELDHLTQTLVNARISDCEALSSTDNMPSSNSNSSHNKSSSSSPNKSSKKENKKKSS